MIKTELKLGHVPVSVHFLNISEVAEINPKLFAEEFPQRYEASKNFVFKEDALRSLGVAALLHSVLGLSEKDVQIGEFGKPYSRAIPQHFSISHSGDYVVLAVSPHNVGVDIEQIDPRHLDVARLVYTAEEIAWYKAAPGGSASGESSDELPRNTAKETSSVPPDAPDDELPRNTATETSSGSPADAPDGSASGEKPEERFMCLWTLKECVSKITGEGLNINYQSFTVMPLVLDGAMEYEKRRLLCKSMYEPEGYCLSVCVEIER